MESERDTSRIVNGYDDAEMLFDPALLTTLDWSRHKATFRGDISPHKPGPNLIMRPLSVDDFDKGFASLLSQLTDVGGLCKGRFLERFYEMKQCPRTYFVVVIEDIEKSQVIGAATLIVEQKFIHNAANRSRVEDVVVRDEYRGRQLGKLLVEVLLLMSQQLGCYKSTLECKEENVKFYEPLGFHVDEQLYMIQRFTT